MVNAINLSGTEKKFDEIKRSEGARGFLPFEMYRVEEADAARSPEPDAKSMDDELEGDEGAVGEEAQADVPRHVIEGLDLKVGAFYVHFCEESFMDLQNLAVLCFDIDAFVANWSKNLHLKANIKAEAVYYNDTMSLWEQLIEKVNIWRLIFWLESHF